MINTLRSVGATDLGNKLRRIGNLQTAKYLASAGVLQSILLTVGVGVMENAILANDEELACYLLDWAMEQHSESIVDVLFQERDARVNPLSTAIRIEKLSLTKTLVARGAPVTDSLLSQAVRMVLASGDDDIVRYLVDQIPSSEFRAPSAVGLALQSGNFSLINVLLDARIDPRGLPVSLLRCWVVRSGKDIPSEDSPRSVLEVAARERHFPILPTLLESVAWSEEDMGPALAWCVKHGNSILVQQLLLEGADVNQVIQFAYEGLCRNLTPLQIAVIHQHIPIIRTLIDADCEFDEPTQKLTPIHLAVKIGNLEIVDMLLEAGAEINNPPYFYHGTTAIQSAARKGDIDLVNKLLERSADVNNAPAPYGGATALQFTTIEGFLGLTRRLVQVGANVNAGRAMEHGRTALEGAAEHGRIDMLQFLLENEALIEGRRRRQFIRAVTMADHNGHAATSRFLKSYGHWNGLDAARYERELQTYEKELDDYDEVGESYGGMDCDNDLIDMTYAEDLEFDRLVRTPA